METRAHHIAVGAFVLLLMVAAAAFVIWISKFQAQAEYARYDILIDDDDVFEKRVGGERRHGGILGLAFDDLFNGYIANESASS